MKRAERRTNAHTVRYNAAENDLVRQAAGREIASWIRKVSVEAARREKLGAATSRDA